MNHLGAWCEAHLRRLCEAMSPDLRLYVIIGMLLIVFGLTYVFLIMVNYGDHNSENVLQTLYENMRTDLSRQNRREKKKPDAKQTSGPVKYKKKKK